MHRFFQKLVQMIHLVIFSFLSLAATFDSQDMQQTTSELEMQRCKNEASAFVSHYYSHGCEKIHPYALNLTELLQECTLGDESILVVYSKLEHVGDHVYSTDTPCLHRNSFTARKTLNLRKKTTSEFS